MKIIYIIDNEPWDDTWNMEAAPTTMLGCARKGKQECKDMFLTLSKHGRTILKLSDVDIQMEMVRLWKSADLYQEEIDYHMAEIQKQINREEIKKAVDERFKREGWPKPLYTVGVQTQLFENETTE